MSCTLTHNIQITVTPRYLPEHSSVERQRYVFAYHVIIENLGEHAVQLLSRHWVITDGDGEQENVRGAGVVGEQPVIQPGEGYQYSSACPLTTPVGSMYGSYQMMTASGEKFDANIQPFTLAKPGILN